MNNVLQNKWVFKNSEGIDCFISGVVLDWATIGVKSSMRPVCMS